MDPIPLEDVGLLRTEELTAALSPKRRRTDFVLPKVFGGNSRFDSSKSWTSPQTTVCPSTDHLRQNDGLISTEEHEQDEEEKSFDALQETANNSVTHLTYLNSNKGHAATYKVCEETKMVEQQSLCWFPCQIGGNIPSSACYNQMGRSAHCGALGLPTPFDEYGAQAQPGALCPCQLPQIPTKDTDMSFPEAVDTSEKNFAAKSITSVHPNLKKSVEQGTWMDKDEHNDVPVSNRSPNEGDGLKYDGVSIMCHASVSERNITAEKNCFEGNNHISSSAGVSQEPSERGSSADAFTVIDPAIWSEIHKEVRQIRSTAERDLPPSFEVHSMKMKHFLCCNFRRSQVPSANQTGPFNWQKENEIVVICHSETHVCHVITKGAEASSCHFESTPSSIPEDSKRQESHEEAKTYRAEHTAEVKDVDKAADILGESTGKLQLHSNQEIPPTGGCICEQRQGQTPNGRLDAVGGDGENKCSQTFMADFPERKEQEEMNKVNLKQEKGGEDSVNECANNTMTSHNEDDPQQIFSYCPTADVSEPFSFPAVSDAVVPGQHHYAALRFTPSAFTPCEAVLGGVDTFEKIKLSPDADDDDDAIGLDSTPVPTSSSRQLQKTEQKRLQPGLPVAGSDDGEKIKLNEDAERIECHTANTGSRGVTGGSGHNEVPNSIPAADVVLTWPEPGPSCGSACDSSEHSDSELKPEPVFPAATFRSDSPPSDLSSSSQFEMKEQFSGVLKELKLFFDISREEYGSVCTSPSLHRSALERKTLECATHQSSLNVHIYKPAGAPLSASDEVEEDPTLEMSINDPTVPSPAASTSGEQEVPFCRTLNQETSIDIHLGQVIGPPDRPRRLEPLKTCRRPIRVGLSKRAKAKPLHRSSPFR